MSHRRYALVGAGHRAQLYVDAITATYRDTAELVAVCEPNETRHELIVEPLTPVAPFVTTEADDFPFTNPPYVVR